MAALLFVGGCELLPGSDRAGSPAPSGLTASAEPADFDRVNLGWDYDPEADRYDLEMRVADGDWQPAAAYEWPNWVDVDPAMPELTPLQFRIRAYRRGRPSAWSDAADFLRGVRPPASFTAVLRQYAGIHTGPVDASWESASLVATELLLERSPLDGNGDVTSWTTLPDAALADGSYADSDLADGLAFAYRIRVGTGGVWSAPREERTEVVDIAASSGLRAVKVEGGVQLTWVVHSATADRASVYRFTREPLAGWDVVVDLPGDAASWLDPAAHVWPATQYVVSADRTTSYLYSHSAAATVEPFAIPGPPALSASSIRLPEGEWAVRDAQGRFHLAQYRYESPRIHRATATGYEAHLLAGATALASPGVLLDAQGAPHTVFIRGTSTGLDPVELVHEWWSGTAWESEVVATDTVAPDATYMAKPAAWFGLGEGGAVQVLYRRTEPFPAPDSLVHVARDGASWATTEVVTSSVTDLVRWSTSFGVAGDGTAYVAQLGQSETLGARLIVLSTRTAGGSWSDEVAITGAMEDGGPWLVAGTAGDVAVAFGVDGTFPDDDVQVVRRVSGGWSAPETVLTVPFDGSALSLAVGGSADGSEVVIASRNGAGTGLFVGDASGWEGTTVGPTAIGPNYGGGRWVDVDANGRAWALFPHDAAMNGRPVPYSLFEAVP